MKRKVKLRNAVIAVILTNLITVSLLVFAPIPVIGGKAIVSKDDYNFVKQFKKLERAQNILEADYVDKLDESKLVEGAVRGMVDSIGDPYTTYMNKKEYDDFTTQTEGSYAGLGIYVGTKDNKIIVIAPIEGSPAEKAGVKSGDAIIKVNGQAVSGKDMDKAVGMMKGKAGTSVTITLSREGKGTFDLSIKREKIVMKTVKGEMLPNNVGLITISTFDENTADSFKTTLAKLQKDGMKGLIIDLRDNPGGLLDQSAEIADTLVGKGTIVYTINNMGQREDWKSDDSKINVPLVLLVNGGTASASEILSGAVRDYKAGTLVGTKTFGKGLVQTLDKLGDGTAVKVTIARYYTPSGECIQKKGIQPDVVVDLPKKDMNRALTHAEDVQLQKAIEVVKSKM